MTTGRRRAVAAAAEADGLEVEHIGLGDAVLAGSSTRPGALDVVVCRPSTSPRPPSVAGCALDDRAASPGAGSAAHGPGMFGPTHGAATDIAGQGVADPRSMLLAAALMLGEGLGERAAAETLSRAVSHALGTASDAPSARRR